MVIYPNNYRLLGQSLMRPPPGLVMEGTMEAGRSSDSENGGMRVYGNEMDDAYFLSMLEPDDMAAMSRDADVVVWTKEYVHVISRGPKCTCRQELSQRCVQVCALASWRAAGGRRSFEGDNQTTARRSPVSRASRQPKLCFRSPLPGVRFAKRECKILPPKWGNYLRSVRFF